MSARQEVGVGFPTSGVDTTCEYGRQPPGTAADASNVRTFEAVTRRNRGGSRPGLSRYIDATVVGDFPVQHLTLLVDPTVDALAAPTDAQFPGFIPDPSTNDTGVRNPPGRFINPRGGLRVPNRNLPTPGGGGGGPQLVQTKTGHVSLPGGTTQTLQFDSPVTSGSLVVAVLVLGSGSTQFVSPGTPYDLSQTPPPLVPSSVRNAGLVDILNVGGTGYYSEFQAVPTGNGVGTAWNYASISLGMFFAVAASADDKTVVVTVPSVDPSFDTSLDYTLIEFTNTRAAAPLDQFSKWSVFAQPLVAGENTIVASGVGVGGTGGLAVSATFSQTSDASPTPLTGFSVVGSSENNVYTGMKPSVNSPGPAVWSFSVTVTDSQAVSSGGVSATFFKL